MAQRSLPHRPRLAKALAAESVLASGTGAALPIAHGCPYPRRRFFLRTLRARLPFRYGIVTMTRVPHLEPHPDGFPMPRIRAGRMEVGSVMDAPFGLAFEPDLSAFTPLDAWSPASLDAAL